MRNFGLALIVFLGFTVNGLSQSNEEQSALQDRIESQRIALITQKLELSPKDAQTFWPIYNEYRAAEKELQARKKPKQRIPMMSEDEASNFLTNLMSVEEDLLSLRRDFMNDLGGIISSKKILRFLQAERVFKERLVQMLRRERMNGR